MPGREVSRAFDSGVRLGQRFSRRGVLLVSKGFREEEVCWSRPGTQNVEVRPVEVGFTKETEGEKEEGENDGAVTVSE